MGSNGDSDRGRTQALGNGLVNDELLSVEPILIDTSSRET